MGLIDPKVQEGINEWKDRLDRGGFNTTEIRAILLDEVMKLCLFEESTITNACALFISESANCVTNILYKE